MEKDILVECLKSSVIAEGKIIVDVRDIMEISGYGWDYTLVHRPAEDPFGNNIIMFHNFISNDEYGLFEDEYKKEKKRKEVEFDKVKVLRNQYDLVRKEHENFMTDNTTHKDGMDQVTITTENIEEFQDIRKKMNDAQEQHRQALVKFHKNETI